MGAIAHPSADGFLANISVVDDKSFEGATPEGLVGAMSGSQHSVMFVADSTTMDKDDRPILCIDLVSNAPHFRVVPKHLWSVANNLSLANMGFAEFAESADIDGVFRGFE